MRTALAAAVTVVALLTLTACGSDSKPTPAATTTAPAKPTLNAEQAAQACTDAVFAAYKAERQDKASEPAKPAACDGISDSDYLDTVVAVTGQLNQDARDKLQKAIDDAAKGDQ